MSADHHVDEGTPPVVIDNGSFRCKAGFAGDDYPKYIFPSQIGRPNDTESDSIAAVDVRDTFVGEQIQKKRDVLSITCPIERGIITNWDDMEKIWQHVFQEELHVESENHPVLLSDVPLNPKTHREKMCEVMFETFKTPMFSVSLGGVLGIYALGRVSSIILDVGHEVSHVLAIYESYTFKNAIDKLNFGGKDLTDYMLEMLNSKSGTSFTSNSEKETVREIKEKLCYTAIDFEKEMERSNSESDAIERTYKLPDGSKITVGSERFHCPEALFQPHLFKKDFPGLHKFFHSSLMKCDVDARPDLMCNMILCGGCTMFPGVKERMQKEMVDLISKDKRVRVIAPPERTFSVWIGGSILAALSYFGTKAVSKKEYEENGPGIVHSKCF
ncbi:actin, clone 302-like [Ruditapes philippinarum]|uniref:actin, clone 302-like n=1 Tax=Ruditapes philippinarum TaxID=129788 RepID=UPI00295C07A6|nr:actin, clone 302-like [Ruditapes philippinarum]